MTKIIDVNIEAFLNALELAKNLKSTYVIIPRILFQLTPMSSILGISYDAIITASYFPELKLTANMWELWKDPSLEFICLMTKDINPFFNIRKKITETNSTDTDPRIEKIIIEAKEYILGRDTISIGYSVGMVDSYPINNYEHPTIPLYPYEDKMDKIQHMFFNSQNSVEVLPPTDVSHNEEFMDIINSKAGIGATIWVPKIGNLSIEQSKMYTMTLTGTLLNVAKGDDIFCSIKDRIMYRTGFAYIVEFIVNKHKKKCILHYYLLMMKVGC